MTPNPTPVSTVDVRPGYEQRAGAHADPRLEWWRQARFGLFIHWGLYAQPHDRWRDYPDSVTHHWTGEWVQHVKRIPVAEYARWAETFNPRGFDAAEWVALARRAGQKYLVITAKHHDGFCLFRTATTDFNIVTGTPFGRDVIAELAAECARQGVRFGVYYSQAADWRHPDGLGNDWDYDPAAKNFDRYLDECVEPQLTELLTHYGPLGLVWFDTPGTMTPAQSRRVVEHVRRLQPACLISGRIGNGLGDYTSFRDNRTAGSVQHWDFESPATMNRTWGYVAGDTGFKSGREQLWTLIDLVSKGGNYLLNVGPTEWGIIPDGNRQPLLEIGSWLEVNGESVHGTVAGPVQEITSLRSTQRDNTLYLHVVTARRGNTYRFPDVGRELRTPVLLGCNSAGVGLCRDGGDWVLQLPSGAVRALPVVVRVTMQG